MRTLFLIVAVLACLAPARAAETAIPNRFDQIKPGEWVLMRDVSGGDRAGETNRITVVRVDGGTVTVRRDHYAADGDLIESRERDLDLARMSARLDSLRERADAIEPGSITVKDETIPVVKVAFTGEDAADVEAKREFMIWVSDRLPIGGLAKTWCSDAGFPQAEVVDYGF